MGAVEGANGGALGAEVSGGGTKKDGLISVVRTVLVMSGVSRERGGAREVNGRPDVVGEMIEGIGIEARVGEPVRAERVGKACVVAEGRGAVVGDISGVLIRTAFWSSTKFLSMKIHRIP